MTSYFARELLRRLAEPPQERSTIECLTHGRKDARRTSAVHSGIEERYFAPLKCP